VAVAFDAVGPSATGQTSSGATTTLSWSHTVGAGSNTVLIVGGAIGNASAPPAITSITYNSVAMTGFATVNSGGLTAGYVAMYYLLNPPAGANTVLVTRGAASTTTMVFGSVSFTGASQTVGDYFVATNQSITAGSTPASVVVPTVSTASQVVDAMCSGSASSTPTSNKTNRWVNAFGSSSAAGVSGQSTTVGTGGNVTMQYTITSDDWAVIGLEVLPFVAKSTARPNYNQAVTRAASF